MLFVCWLLNGNRALQSLSVSGSGDQHRKQALGWFARPWAGMGVQVGRRILTWRGSQSQTSEDLLAGESQHRQGVVCQTPHGQTSWFENAGKDTVVVLSQEQRAVPWPSIPALPPPCWVPWESCSISLCLVFSSMVWSNNDTHVAGLL